MQHIWHRLVGTRGPFSLFPDPLSSLNEPASTTSNFGKISKFPSKEIARHKLVFLGETDFEQLVDKYHETGEEGHHLEPYRELLEDAKSQGIHLHAGFLPRKYARMLMQDGEKSALEAAKKKKWLPDDVNLDSSDFHYNVFESLLSGRSLYNEDSSDNDEKISDCPSDQFRNIFKAQVLKDEAMAHRVTGLIQNNNEEEEVDNEKFLVIAGNGHLLHYCGVPERVLRENPDLAKKAQIQLILCTFMKFRKKFLMNGKLRKKPKTHTTRLEIQQIFPGIV